MKALTLNDYTILSDGRVFITKWNREVTQSPNSKGYLRIRVGGKRYFVHRLVAEKYVPNPENKPQVNHKDGNKLNNRADNLEWVTNLENRKHATVTGLQWSKLTISQVRYIKNHKEMESRELADMFGVTRHCINKIKSGINFKNIE